MEEYKQQYKKQQQIKNRLVKQIKKNFTSDELQILEIEQEQPIEIEPIIEEKPKRERVKTAREQQMNRPLFNTKTHSVIWWATRNDIFHILAEYIWRNNKLEDLKDKLDTSRILFGRIRFEMS